MTHSLIFFGSDQYSAIVLSSLLESGVYRLISVVTDHYSGQTPVEKLAIKHNLKVSYYPSIPTILSKNTIGLCASFDHLLPSAIIDRFAGNLYNLHPSLLPQYRNVSPVQYAIALGDKETGITLFRISPTIDNGEIIAQVSEPIHKGDTTPTLTTRLFTLGAKLFIDSTQRSFTTLRLYDFKPTSLVFTHRLTRASGYIEWPTLHKLLLNQPLCTSSAVAPEKCLQTQSDLGGPSETKNELLKLRLQKIKSSGLEFGAWNLVLSDLCRSLYPWPGVWSLVPTKKGEQRISLIYNLQSTISILISGKPAPILYNDFIKYYLGE